MTIRETAIAKLQQLPEPLLQEVSDFIDFVAHKHSSQAANSEIHSDASQKWEKWFEATDHLDTALPENSSDYQQLLLNKYRQQGLDL